MTELNETQLKEAEEIHDKVMQLTQKMQRNLLPSMVDPDYTSGEKYASLCYLATSYGCTIGLSKECQYEGFKILIDESYEAYEKMKGKMDGVKEYMDKIKELLSEEKK